MKKFPDSTVFNKVKAAKTCVALATLSLALSGCVYAAPPPYPPGPAVVSAPAPGYCCYAYPEYPAGYYGYGYGGPSVSFGYYGGGGRGYGHWR